MPRTEGELSLGHYSYIEKVEEGQQRSIRNVLMFSLGREDGMSTIQIS